MKSLEEWKRDDSGFCCRQFRGSACRTRGQAAVWRLCRPLCHGSVHLAGRKKLKNTNSSSAVEWEAGEQRDGMQSLRKRRVDGRTTTEYYILSLRHTRSEAVWLDLVYIFDRPLVFYNSGLYFFIISAIIPVSNSSKGCIHHMNSWSLLLSFLSFTSKQSGLATLAKQLACLQPVAYVFRFNRPCCGSIWPEPTDMMTKITKTTTAFSSAPTSKSPEYEKNTLSC